MSELDVSNYVKQVAQDVAWKEEEIILNFLDKWKLRDCRTAKELEEKGYKLLQETVDGKNILTLVKVIDTYQYKFVYDFKLGETKYTGDTK